MNRLAGAAKVRAEQGHADEHEQRPESDER